MSDFTGSLGRGLGAGVGLMAGALIVREIARKVKKKPKGWKSESARHALARKGIKTGRKKKKKKVK